MELLFHSFMEEADSKYWKQFLAKTNFYSRLGEFKSCNMPFTSSYVQKCTELDVCAIVINIAKCPAEAKRKPSRCTFRIGICVWFIF